MASSCPTRLHPRPRLRPWSHLRLVVSSLALAAIAACEPAISGSPRGDGPPVGTQYHLRLRQGTMTSLVPGWPFGDGAAWGVVRFPYDARFADLRAPGLTGRAHVVWQDTTLGRVAPPGAPTSLRLEDTVDGAIVSSGGISVAGTPGARGFSPPEPFTLAVHARDSVVATLGDIRLTGMMRHDGSVRGTWQRRGTDGHTLAHGRFELEPVDAELRAMMRAHDRDVASGRRAPRPGRPVPDTIAR